ncbi:MAG: 6-bladed beta-propeller [Gemmatimonadetes bacterium]|nr:6-bladed beta-propeller [Gemmatimonadota bacterium]
MMHPRSRHRVAYRLALSFAALLSSACDRGPQAVSGLQCEPHPSDIATLDFAEAFVPLEPLVFRTSDPNPVLSARTLSVSPSGQLLLVDSRSFNLKVADSEGRVIQVIGGEGEGPGEFTALMDAVFLRDDRILALDAGRVLATLFDTTGEVLNAFQLEDQLDPRAVVAMDKSSFLIGGMVTTPGEGNDMARIYSLDGTTTDSFLPADQLLFDTQMIVDGVWGVALPGGTVALGLDVTAAIHLFSETGAHICTQASEPPRWSQLLPRDDPVAMDQATREWIRQATITIGAAYASGRLYRQYRSSAEDGVSLLAEYDADLNLRNVYTSLPGRLVGGGGETLFILGDESRDDTRVLRYRASQRE